MIAKSCMPRACRALPRRFSAGSKMAAKRASVIVRADLEEKAETAVKEAAPDAVADAAGGNGAAPATSPGEDYAKTMNGISAPFGYFDPLGLAGNAPVEQVKRYRESELTHGRVCMLASLGILVGEAVQDANLLLNSDGHIKGPAIYHFQQISQGFWEPLVLAIGIAEAYRVSVGWADPTAKGVFTLEDDYRPGDLGFDPLGLCPTDPKEFDALQTREINNGRLAMIATAGFVAQELVNGKGIVENLQ